MAALHELERLFRDSFVVRSHPVVAQMALPSPWKPPLEHLVRFFPHPGAHSGTADGRRPAGGHDAGGGAGAAAARLAGHAAARPLRLAVDAPTAAHRPPSAALPALPSRRPRRARLPHQVRPRSRPPRLYSKLATWQLFYFYRVLDFCRNWLSRRWPGL